ncbi:hypothetical protein [Nonomuraea aridisoli]|nr:hypothetical protein [Nonomuraea aridisoli]
MHVDHETTLEQPRVIDARPEAGEKLGFSAGLPIAHRSHAPVS